MQRKMPPAALACAAAAGTFAGAEGAIRLVLKVARLRPNSVLTMQRKPKLVRAFVQMQGAIWDPESKVYTAIINDFIAREADMLACLNRSERSAFAELLDKIVANSETWALPY